MSSPAAPRPSTSVILVRDGPAGLETFMVRRHERSRFAPGAYVFPGGTVRADDTLEADAATLLHALTARGDSSLEPQEALGLWVSAVRELFEEAGVLLASDARGQLVGIDDGEIALRERLAAARLMLQADQLSLADLFDEHGWQPAFEHLVPFSHWVTPTVAPLRFDTRFFVAEMPAGQEALHCTIETTEGRWLQPRRVLDDADLHVVYATEQHLRRLAPCASAAEALRFAAAKPIRRIEPTVTREGERLQVWIEPELVDAW